MPQVPSDGASAQKEFLTFKSGRSSRRSRGKPARHGSARGCRVLEMIGTPGETHSAWRHLIGPAPLGVLAARHRLPAAARAQPIYEPSCRQRGQQACDDHAHADEHITIARACVLCPKTNRATKKWPCGQPNNHSAAALHLVPRSRPTEPSLDGRP